jgi:hypothetical protein
LDDKEVPVHLGSVPYLRRVLLDVGQRPQRIFTRSGGPELSLVSLVLKDGSSRMGRDEREAAFPGGLLLQRITPGGARTKQ